MTAVPCDAQTLARTLRDMVKLTPEQAEGFADAMAEDLQGDRITKADLCAELAEMRAEIVRGVAGSIGPRTRAIIGAVVALSRSRH